MSLLYAILGILQVQPMTGYDLKTQFFDDSIAHFWSADQAQIYRTLDKLSEQGFVESQLEIQEDRPNRKVYSITEKGHAELRRWLTTDQALHAVREPFLIQLFFSAQLPNETVIEKLERQLQAHQERLKIYEQIPLLPLDDPAISREQTFERLTLELGLLIEEAYIKWLEKSIDTVRGLE